MAKKPQKEDVKTKRSGKTFQIKWKRNPSFFFHPSLTENLEIKGSHGVKVQQYSSCRFPPGIPSLSFVGRGFDGNNRRLSSSASPRPASRKAEMNSLGVFSRPSQSWLLILFLIRGEGARALIKGEGISPSIFHTRARWQRFPFFSGYTLRFLLHLCREKSLSVVKTYVKGMSLQALLKKYSIIFLKVEKSLSA